MNTLMKKILRKNTFNNDKFKGYQGLKNKSNCCFFNSSMQMIIRIFSDLSLKKIENSQNFGWDFRSLWFDYKTALLRNELSEKLDHLFVAKCIKLGYIKIDEITRAVLQQDSSEFLLSFLKIFEMKIKLWLLIINGSAQIV